jgi:hypothetical protein
MRGIRLPLLLVAASCLLAGPASALVLSISATVGLAAGDQQGFFQTGDSIDIVLEVDDSPTDLNPTGGNGLFVGALQSLSITFGAAGGDIALTAGPSASSTISTFDDAVGAGTFLDTAVIGAQTNLGGAIDGKDLVSLALTFSSQGTSPPDLLVDDYFGPPPLPPLFSLSVAITTQEMGGDPLGTSVVAAVPEPRVATLLVLAGLATMLRLRR